jgi:hypothetical protein
MSPTTGDDDYIIPGCLATIKNVVWGGPRKVVPVNMAKV